MKKQTKKWTMKDGTKIRICDMENDHLEKTLMFLYRHASAKRNRTEAFYLSCTPPTADGASLAFEQEFEHAIESEWEDYLPSIFNNLWSEAKRRRLPLPRPLCFYYPNEEL